MQRRQPCVRIDLNRASELLTCQRTPQQTSDRPTERLVPVPRDLHCCSVHVVRKIDRGSHHLIISCINPSRNEALRMARSKRHVSRSGTKTNEPAGTDTCHSVPGVELQAVRDAYSARSEQYIDLFGGDWQAHEDETALIRRHLTGLPGPVLDLGCGPGYWSAYLHSMGTDVTGIDMVPEFIAQARVAHPGPQFRLGSMTELDIPEHSVSGILAWYSTIHLPPAELDQMLGTFRRLLVSDGILVAGFFDSDDEVAAFDHAVITAYRWPADRFADRLAKAGFAEVQRLQQQFAERPDRKYAAIAARAS
jgi:SAM-dependent methyltransferase